MSMHSIDEHTKVSCLHCTPAPPPAPHSPLGQFEQIGKKKAIVRKGGPWMSEEPDENPYSEINIEGEPFGGGVGRLLFLKLILHFFSKKELWGSLEKPEDVRRNKCAVRTLRSRQIKILAGTAMDLIESEARLHRLMGRLSDLIMLDDPFCQDLDLSGVPEEELKAFRQVVQ
ncbi:hypothetical protein HDU67_003124, partial [Dinochytrium kinnereticum]